MHQRTESLQERRKRSTIVIRAETIEAVAFERGLIGVARPGRHGLHGVDVGIQQERWSQTVLAWSLRPKVVGFALNSQSPLLHELQEEVGGNAFVATGARRGDELHQEVERLGGE